MCGKMRIGKRRDEIVTAIDETEADVNEILSDLEEAEEIAAWDAEALSKQDIEKLQTAVIETVKALKELSAGLA